MPVDVLIVLGSKSDSDVGKKAASVLDEFGIGYEMVVASAHRTPDLLRDLIRNTTAKVFIAIAGLSAALPGTIAAHTTKPVIGVPVSGKLNLDAVLSVSQMPPGVPVAAVGLDRGENAAILAVEILALRDERLVDKLKEHREALKKWVLEDSRTLGERDSTRTPSLPSRSRSSASPCRARRSSPVRVASTARRQRSSRVAPSETAFSRSTSTPGSCGKERRKTSRRP